ncbi:hypothetical protein JCM10003_2809 [Bacteroides pyogenes JCM 10003]|nr:hypothetical protein JCM10003_2809 [Bacteroides pyogenes JCM 10003]
MGRFAVSSGLGRGALSLFRVLMMFAMAPICKKEKANDDTPYLISKGLAYWYLYKYKLEGAALKNRIFLSQSIT